MNCPSKVSREEFNAAIDDAVHTFKRDGEKWLCPKCASVIQQKTAFVSVHDKRFSECVGNGMVVQVWLPYCPQCEPEIAAKSKLHGCVHL